MNIFKPELGGHKYSLDDFVFIQNSNVEQFKNLIKSLTGGSVDETIILYGCAITKVGDNYSYTAGAIYYNGEIYSVESLVAPLVDTGNPKWAIVETYPANNPILYKDGHPVNVHAIRKMKLVLSSETGEFVYNDVSIVKLSDKIKADNKVDKLQEDWKYIGTPGQPVLGNGWVNSVGVPLRYMKDSMGFVHIEGEMLSGATSFNAFTLPAGYRPDREVYPSVCKSGGGSVAQLYITIGGGVGVISYGSGGTNTSVLMHIVFKAAN